MNKYQDLVEKRAASHALCAEIDAELEKMQPPEVWIAFHADKKIYAFHSEKEASEWAKCFIKSVVRYILPDPIAEAKVRLHDELVKALQLASAYIAYVKSLDCSLHEEADGTPACMDKIIEALAKCQAINQTTGEN